MKQDPSRAIGWSVVITTAIMVFSSQFIAVAQTGIDVPSMHNCDNLVQSFLSTYGIPGATFALTKNGKLVYMRAFGTADQSGAEFTQPYHLFRIASVSKPITSIAIMKLREEGMIDLDDHVFGPGGLLYTDLYYDTANITDSRVYDITVRNLMEHSAGWNRDIPITPNPPPPYTFYYFHSDPPFFPLHVTLTLGESNPVTERALVKFSIERGLDFTPGTSYNYSNIGYLILGVVIEHVTGMSYEKYVTSEILEPLGIYDMHLGKNLLADKQEREGEYNSPYVVPSCYGTGAYVPWQYGGWSVEAMDAHGGWIATARDLVRLLVAVDGFSSKPDILTQSSLDTMTVPSANNANYAKGWAVNSAPNWWHMGSLDGTASFVARTSHGYTWAIILNRRASGSFMSDLDALPWNCLASTSSYPSFDLLDFPSQNGSNISFANTGANHMTVQWTNGNGDGRLLLASSPDSTTKYPLDGTSYSADSSFGMGSDLGDGNYVVYSGTGSSVTVDSLSPVTLYHFRLFEFNKNSTTGNYELYQLGKSERASNQTEDITVTLVSPNNAFINPYPSITLQWNSNYTGHPDYVQVSTDSTFAGGMILNDSTIEGTDTTVEIVSNNSTYYWRVRSGGVWTGVWKFTNQVVPPSAPVLAIPSNGAVDQPISLTFQWLSSITASSFRLQVSPDSTFGTTTIDDSTLTDTLYVPGIALLNDTTYYWRVRSKNISGTNMSERWSFKTIIDTPDVPVHVSPLSGSLDEPFAISLEWNPSDRGVSYRLQVSTDSMFTTTLIDSVDTTTSRLIGSLSGHTKYFWRVSGINPGGESDFSSPWNFTTMLDTPTLISPENGALGYITTVCRWNTVFGATQYELQVATDSLFVDSLVSDEITPDTSFILSSLSNQETYYWRVRAGDGITAGNWSTSRHFTVTFLTIPLPVVSGWNIVSIPIALDDARKSVIFPNAISHAFAYQGKYFIQETLKVGVGYWIKFSAAETVQITGTSGLNDTLEVGERWNLIGSSFHDISVPSVMSNPGGIVTTSFFGYDELIHDYFIADTIQPGRGYWVKVAQEGELILSGTGEMSPSNRIRIVPTAEQPPPPPDQWQAMHENIPSNFRLEQNHPNPFNPVTAITYALPYSVPVRLSVYNILGEEMSVLVNEIQEEGNKTVLFDASNLPSGIYTYRLTAGTFSDVKKMVVMK